MDNTKQPSMMSDDISKLSEEEAIKIFGPPPKTIPQFVVGHLVPELNETTVNDDE